MRQSCFPLQHCSDWTPDSKRKGRQIDNNACVDLFTHSVSLYRCVLYFAPEAEHVSSTFLHMEALVRRSARTQALGGRSPSCSSCSLRMWSLSKQTFYFPSCFCATECNTMFNSTFYLESFLSFFSFSTSLVHFFIFFVIFILSYCFFGFFSPPLPQFPIPRPFLFRTLRSRHLKFPLLDESEIGDVKQQPGPRVQARPEPLIKRLAIVRNL